VYLYRPFTQRIIYRILRRRNEKRKEEWIKIGRKDGKKRKETASE
jgi:hypothetical protein